MPAVMVLRRLRYPATAVLTLTRVMRPFASRRTGTLHMASNSRHQHLLLPVTIPLRLSTSNPIRVLLHIHRHTTNEATTLIRERRRPIHTTLIGKRHISTKHRLKLVMRPTEVMVVCTMEHLGSRKLKRRQDNGQASPVVTVARER